MVVNWASGQRQLALLKFRHVLGGASFLLIGMTASVTIRDSSMRMDLSLHMPRDEASQLSTSDQEKFVARPPGFQLSKPSKLDPGLL
jgi:hypothetical protein